MNNISYRKDQLPIINYQSGTMSVPAVPGAGKTFIVTNLVAKLLEERKNDGKKILILTYMNSAVNNFKGRIKKILEENEISSRNYDVMTIHSLAIKIIRENPEAIMLNEDFNVIDDLQKNIVLNDCIERFKLSGGEKALEYFIREQKNLEWKEKTFRAWQDGFFDILVNSISKLKYSGVTSENLNGLLYSDEIRLLKLVCPIYKQYEKYLKQNGLLDYDDILILAHKILILDEKFRVKFENRYKYIFEDECQDSNEIQGEIIKLISMNTNNLVRVGDVNQSVTGTFSSSNPKFFKDFISKSDYCYRMDMSNRSSSAIIDLANELVNYVQKELKQVECRDALEDIKIKTVPNGLGYKENPKCDDYNINVKIYNTWNDEVLNTIRYVKGINKKYPQKSIGILVPYNSQVSQIAALMELDDIDFEELSPNSTKKRRILNNILKILDFVLNCDNLQKFLFAVDYVYLDSFSIELKKKFMDILILKKYSVNDLMYGCLESICSEIFKIISLDEKKSFLVLVDKFKYSVDLIREIIEYPRTKLDLFISFLGNRVIINKDDMAVVDYISFYVRYLSNESINTSLRNIYDLLNDSRSKAFSHILDVVYEMNGYEAKSGSITICNYHKSKGLEWDAVFLLGLNSYNFPDNINQKFQGEKWFLKERYKNPIAVVKQEIDVIANNKKRLNYMNSEKISSIGEKIRLLYVGITRAKEMLVLSCSYFNDVNDINKKNKKQEPSEYLKKLGKYISNNRSK